jgi:hypothetical protein
VGKGAPEFATFDCYTPCSFERRWYIAEGAGRVGGNSGSILLMRRLRGGFKTTCIKEHPYATTVFLLKMAIRRFYSR